jgi:hypothetical protein
MTTLKTPFAFPLTLRHAALHETEAAPISLGKTRSHGALSDHEDFVARNENTQRGSL